MRIYKCEEIEVREDTPVYNPDDDTCTVESEVFFYVDLDANTMYDPEIDGEQFAYDLSTTVDETGDARARQVGRARRDALADVPNCPEVERRVGALGEVNRSGWIRVETRIVLERVMTRAF